MGEGDFAVEIFGEGFQVNVGCVNVVVDIVESVVGDVAVGDHDGLQAVGFGGFADINDVFAPDGGLVVGEGDGIAAIFERKTGYIFGRNLFCMDLILMRFGNVPVLTEEAAHVAARRAHAEYA